ncbi:hypothetical protein ACLKA7_011065 [Drosophila subpalustris]
MAAFIAKQMVGNQLSAVKDAAGGVAISDYDNEIIRWGAMGMRLGQKTWQRSLPEFSCLSQFSSYKSRIRIPHATSISIARFLSFVARRHRLRPLTQMRTRTRMRMRALKAAGRGG